MKRLLNNIFVVEGKHDAERLTKIGVPYVVITDGTKVSRETSKHLQNLENYHKIIILTDPDKPGAYISLKLSKYLKNPVFIRIPKMHTIKNNSVGIENVPLPVLKESIANYLEESFETSSDITYIELIQLGLMGPGSKAKKLLLNETFHLLNFNLKNTHIQLQLLNISLAEVKEALHE